MSGGHRKIGRPKLRWSNGIRRYINETIKIEGRECGELKLNAPIPNREALMRCMFVHLGCAFSTV